MQHNLAVVRSCVPKAKIWAVVKANAYGHGLDRSMRAFAAADGLALIELDSALHLRETGWKKPILLLEGFFDPRDLAVIAEHGLAFSVHCNEQIAMLEKTRLNSRLDVHLKMNTGMNRLGFKPRAYRAAYERLRAIPAVGSISFMTHFANAEERGHERLSVQEQYEQFQGGSADLEGQRNLSNSAAILLHPGLSTDWVRPGIMLYGGTPGNKTAQEFGLIPAMTLNSEIIQVLDIEPGEAVGYGSLFVATQPMKIGVVACGYADGYPRCAPNGTPILVEGVRTQLLGRVSMDMITVDLTPVPTARVGSIVTLWGDSLPIDEVAAAAGSVGYELMCALSLRPRIVEI
jgi:alanine racemase